MFVNPSVSMKASKQREELFHREHVEAEVNPGGREVGHPHVTGRDTEAVAPGRRAGPRQQDLSPGAPPSLCGFSFPFLVFVSRSSQRQTPGVCRGICEPHLSPKSLVH